MCKVEAVKCITFMAVLDPSACPVCFLFQPRTSSSSCNCMLKKRHLRQTPDPHKSSKIHILDCNYGLFSRGILLGMCWPNPSYISTHGWLNSGRTEIDKVRHAVADRMCLRLMFTGTLWGPYTTLYLPQCFCTLTEAKYNLGSTSINWLSWLLSGNVQVFTREAENVHFYL